MRKHERNSAELSRNEMEESSRISRLRQLFPVCENRFCPVLVRWLMVASARSQSFQDCRGVDWLQFGFDFDSFV